MSHSLDSVFVVKSSEATKEALNSNDFLFREHEGFLVITENILKFKEPNFNFHSRKDPSDVIEKVLNDIDIEDFVILSTSYFGGCGEQSAKYINLKTGQKDFSEEDNSINTMLKKLGVNRNEKYDEFDIVCLRRYRDNEDIIPEEAILSHKQKMEEIANKKYQDWKTNFEKLSPKESLKEVFEITSHFKKKSGAFSSSTSFIEDEENYEKYCNIERYLKEIEESKENE